MPSAYLVLLGANVIYATAPTVARVVVQDVAPVILSFATLVVASVILVPLAMARRRRAPVSSTDRWRILLMGLIGFTVAYSLSNWGIRLSTASDASLLITVEPASLILLSPVLLGERLNAREGFGAFLTLLGAAVVVMNGIPGITTTWAPRWRGDVLLLLAAPAYAAYSLLGRSVLSRHPAIAVTAWSAVCGTAGMAPLAALEWLAGGGMAWTPAAVTGTLYLGAVVTALGFAAWNYALERVEAPRAAIFLNLQPLAGALLGAVWLGEPVTPFTISGGLLILVGLRLTLRTQGQAKRA